MVLKPRVISGPALNGAKVSVHQKRLYLGKPEGSVWISKIGNYKVYHPGQNNSFLSNKAMSNRRIMTVSGAVLEHRKGTFEGPVKAPSKPSCLWSYLDRGRGVGNGPSQGFSSIAQKPFN